jgi:hypothetical protein
MSEPCRGTLRCDGCEDAVCAECGVFVRVECDGTAREVPGLWMRRDLARVRDYDSVYCTRCHAARVTRRKAT